MKRKRPTLPRVDKPREPTQPLLFSDEDIKKAAPNERANKQWTK
jgi:hypothetical protein